jgi:hypothetical protein
MREILTCLLRSSVMREICIFLRPMVVVNRVKPFEMQNYRIRWASRDSGLTVHQHSICNRTKCFAVYTNLYRNYK